MTLKTEPADGFSPCVGKFDVNAEVHTLRLSVVVGKQREKTSVLALFAASRVSDLKCTLRTHFYHNLIAITLTTFLFVEERWLIGKITKFSFCYMLLPPSQRHGSASPVVMLLNMQKWPFYLLLSHNDV